MITVLMRLRLRIDRKQELLPVVSRTLPTTIGSCLGLDLGSKITRMRMVLEQKKSGCLLVVTSIIIDRGLSCRVFPPCRLLFSLLAMPKVYREM
jgi:hypothetical protein